MIQRIKNKPLINDIKQYDAVLLMMNINNSMPDGFLREVLVNFPSVQEKEIESGYGDRRKYGNVFFIDDVLPFYVCYVIRKGQVDEECLDQSLEKIATLCKNKKIASILVGDEKIYKKYFGKNKDIELYLYDDVNVGYSKKYFQNFKSLRIKLKSGEITKEEYEKLYTELQWERFHGIYNEMPKGWKFIPTDKNIFKL